MRRKWTPMGYRILRVSHFLRAISRRGASAGASLSRFPLVTSGSRRLLARIVTRRKCGINVHDKEMGQGSSPECEENGAMGAGVTSGGSYSGERFKHHRNGG